MYQSLHPKLSKSFSYSFSINKYNLLTLKKSGCKNKYLNQTNLSIKNISISINILQ